MKCKKCGGNRTAEKCNLCELFAAGYAGGHSNGSGWPMVSEALACDPRQVKQHQERARRHGINVTYRPDGCVEIPDRGERKKLLKLEKMHDNNSFTGY